MSPAADVAAIKSEDAMADQAAWSRRRFIQVAAGAAGAAGLVSVEAILAQRAGQEPILLNHVGFCPAASKIAYVPGASAGPFTVVNSSSGQTAFSGSAAVISGDFGSFGVCDFGALRQAGSYVVQMANRRSGPFSIAPDIYDAALGKSLAYLSRQRCGDSTTGYHAPCHLDDGKRTDTGAHHDATGGWHDACDLRKWVDATIYAMIGLSRIAGRMSEQRDAIEAELRWGNRYFLNMQEPAGFLMNYCGGDDGNYFTDNRVGTSDDRPIHVEQCELPAQFHFIAAQAFVARFVRDKDPDYAHRCELAARKCWQWCTANNSPGAATTLSAQIMAIAEMHRAWNDPAAPQLVAEAMKRLLSLQVTTAARPDQPTGYFRTARDDPSPYRQIKHGNLPLVAMAVALDQFGTHADAPTWRAGLRHYADHLATMARRSGMGIVPFGLYESPDPGGNRRIGPMWYRWFMKPRGEESANETWWVGINANLASSGVGLALSARLLGDASLFDLAQRQLDWILGANPFDASTMTDVGRNQPQVYRPDAFKPPTPVIPGGVTNGIGGDASDRPQLLPGSWNTCEYWTPMLAWTMWLMAELQNGLGMPAKIAATRPATRGD